MRIGTVRTYDARLITVNVGGGTLVAMPYLRGYQPLLGDLVTCVNQGAVWFCVGPATGSPPDNAVVNPSFETSGTGSMASGWGAYHDPSSTATASVTVQNVFGSSTVDGSQCLRVGVTRVGVTDPQFSFDSIYSSPIAVTPGDRWSAAAHVQRQDDTQAVTPASVIAGVFLSWYSNNTDVYPTTSAANSAQSIVAIDNAPGWALLGAATSPTGITVPGAANFMRVILYSEILFPLSFISTAPLYWDLVIARKVS
jgi:hypothetical protein